MTTAPPQATPLLQLTLPAHASSVTFNKAGRLAVGSDDGSVRFYSPPDGKVKAAIRGLGESVSSIVFAEDEKDDVWLAAGTDLFLFDLSKEKLVYNVADTEKRITVREDKEDVLNQIALNGPKTCLAFSSDSGVVGIMDAPASGEFKVMKGSHQSICGSVSFIPDRPNELVSGGYDHALLHFDFKQRTLLSRYDIAPPMATSGVSLAPPFIQCISVLPSGIIVAGTADGNLWVGLGGEKSSAAATTGKGKYKKSRKWGGLEGKMGSYQKVAEGPVVAICPTGPRCFVWSTLLGNVFSHEIIDGEDPDSDQSGGPKTELKGRWKIEAGGCAKVNALACHHDASNLWVAIAGLDSTGKKGVVEVWRVE